jgi:hypothetical protein
VVWYYHGIDMKEAVRERPAGPPSQPTGIMNPRRP